MTVSLFLRRSLLRLPIVAGLIWVSFKYGELVGLLSWACWRVALYLLESALAKYEVPRSLAKAAVVWKDAPGREKAAFIVNSLSPNRHVNMWKWMFQGVTDGRDIGAERLMTARILRALISGVGQDSTAEAVCRCTGCTYGLKLLVSEYIQDKETLDALFKGVERPGWSHGEVEESAVHETMLALVEAVDLLRCRQRHALGLVDVFTLREVEEGYSDPVFDNDEELVRHTKVLLELFEHTDDFFKRTNNISEGEGEGVSVSASYLQAIVEETFRCGPERAKMAVEKALLAWGVYRWGSRDR